MLELKPLFDSFNSLQMFKVLWGKNQLELGQFPQVWQGAKQVLLCGLMKYI